MTRRRGLLAVLAACACAAVPYTAAHADLDGPDDTIATAAGPLQPGTTYDGTFVGPDDVDHLAFDVAAGQTLHFDVENATAPCRSAYQTGCPIYGTLLDGGARQLGGEGSAAGTGAVYPGDTEGIDWTFAAAGRYYLVLDSAGDLPDYRVRFAVVPPPAGAGSGAGPGGTGSSAGGSGAAGGTAAGGASGAGSTTSGGTTGGAGAGGQTGLGTPLLRVLGVSRASRSGVVTARVKVARPLTSLVATLVPRGAISPLAGRAGLRAVGKGTVVVRVAAGPVTRARLRRGQLRLALRLVARPAGGGAAVTLVRRVPT